MNILIGNLLDAFAEIDPARIIVKQKLQILPHIVDDVERFGPPPRYSTETYESFNKYFRLSSIFSNHHSPSRDIAIKMANLDCVRHIVTGGFWQDCGGELKRADESVLSVFRDSPLLRHHFGLTAITPRSSSGVAGSAILPARNKRISVTLYQNATVSSIPISRLPPALHDPSSQWILGASVTAKSGDQCSLKSWVFIEDSQVSNTIFL